MKNVRKVETYANGKMIPHAEPSMRQPMGVTGKARTIIAAIKSVQMMIVGQNRFQIFGSSMKKVERSTSCI